MKKPKGRNQGRDLSGYRALWLFVMFDVPMDTSEARRDYNHLLKRLKKEGFTRIQLSIYARYCPSEDFAKPYRNRIKTFIPPDGHVRFISITDAQFGKMESYYGKSREKVEEPPEQMQLF